MSGLDELKKNALQVSDEQEELGRQFSGLVDELNKDAGLIAKALGSHKTRESVVNAIKKASQAVESAAESCNNSAAVTRAYVAQHFGGQ